MKILKGIILVIIALAASFFIFAAFLPSEIKISRSIEIMGSPEKLSNTIADFNYYQKWNPWSQKELSAETSMSGEPKQPGHKWTWKGKEIGEGSLTIESLEPGKFIQSRLEFITPMQTIASDHWDFEQIGDKTKATWIYEGKLKYPVERFFGLFLDKMLGKEFEAGLTNLKQLVESMPDEIEEVQTANMTEVQ